LEIFREPPGGHEDPPADTCAYTYFLGFTQKPPGGPPLLPSDASLVVQLFEFYEVWVNGDVLIVGLEVFKVHDHVMMINCGLGIMHLE